LGLLGGEQIERVVVTASGEVARDEMVDRAGDLIEQLGDIVVPRRGQRVEQHRAVGVGREIGDRLLLVLT
jgi:hypothetical protein